MLRKPTTRICADTRVCRVSRYLGPFKTTRPALALSFEEMREKLQRDRTYTRADGEVLRRLSKEAKQARHEALRQEAVDKANRVSPGEVLPRSSEARLVDGLEPDSLIAASSTSDENADVVDRFERYVERRRDGAFQPVSYDVQRLKDALDIMSEEEKRELAEQEEWHRRVKEKGTAQMLRRKVKKAERTKIERVNRVGGRFLQLRVSRPSVEQGPPELSSGRGGQTGTPPLAERSSSGSSTGFPDRVGVGGNAGIDALRAMKVPNRNMRVLSGENSGAGRRKGGEPLGTNNSQMSFDAHRQRDEALMQYAKQSAASIPKIPLF